MPLDDPFLLRRYVDDDDQDAFSQVVRRNTDAVFTAALRRVGGDAHLAQDVVQDVFLSLARHARQLRQHESLSSWLYTATRHAAANRVRGEVRRRAREQEAQTMHELHQAGEPEVDWRRVAPVLDGAIDELAERDRAALLLRFFDRRTFGEMGAALRITEDAARMRVERALDRLHGLLAGRGVRSSTALLGLAMTQHAVQAAPAGLAAHAIGEVFAHTTGPGARLVDFLASFRPGERLVLALAAVAIVGSWVFVRVQQVSAQEAKQQLAAEATAVATLQRQWHDELARPLPALPTPAPGLMRAMTPGASTPPARWGGGRRTALAALYDSFYRQQGLTPDQIERFERTLLPVADATLWVSNEVAEDAGTPPPSAGELAGQLRAVLGEAAYLRYLDFRRLVPAREAVMQVAGSVYLTAPLSADQGARLTELLARASPTYRAGGDVALANVDWEHLQLAAGPVLSSSQLAALQAVRQQATYVSAVQTWALNSAEAAQP